MNAVGSGYRGADLDVAVTGLGGGGLHAEGDNIAGTGGFGGSMNRGLQGGFVGDRGIRRHDPQHGVRLLFGDQHRGSGDRGGAVAAHRLQHDAGIADADGAKLFGDQETVLVVADDKGWCKRR